MHRTVEAFSCHDRNGAVSFVLLAVSLTLLLLVCLSTGCGASSSSIEQVVAPVSISQTKESESDIRPTNVMATSTLSSVAPPRSHLVEAGISVPANLNPLIADSYASQRVMDNLFDSLLNVNAENAVLEPALASQWQVSEDCLTATFQLRPDVLWHDGEPFTANDVTFTFEGILDSDLQSPYAANLVAVDTFFAPDEQTLVVTFDRPDCSLLYDVGQIPILTQHLIEEEKNSHIDVLAAQVYLDHPIGTGPFKFKSKLPTGEIHLERNENYFAGVPHIPEWVYRPLGDEQELLSDLRAGEVDLALVTPQDVQHFQSGETVDIIAFPQPEYYALALNNAHSLLSDVRTRQALAYALDRQQLVQELLNGYGQIIDSPWLPDHWVYAKPDFSIAYDPESARQLLSEAGWTDSNQDGLLDRDGSPLQISISVNSENSLRKRIAFAVQRYWIDAGISAEIYFVEFSTLLEQLFSHNFDSAVFSWPVHQDPDQSLLWASEESDLDRDFNFISYANPIVDKALAEGLTVPFCDREARSYAYQQAISTLAEEQPYIFLFVPQNIIAVSRRLSGVQPGPYADLSWNIHKWTLEHTDS